MLMTIDKDGDNDGQDGDGDGKDGDDDGKDGAIQKCCITFSELDLNTDGQQEIRMGKKTQPR